MSGLVEQVQAEVAEWKRTRVYSSVTTSVDDPEFRISVDDEVNVHMGAIYMAMSLEKWRELHAAIEAAVAEKAEVSA